MGIAFSTLECFSQASLAEAKSPTSANCQGQIIVKLILIESVLAWTTTKTARKMREKSSLFALLE